MNVIGDRGCLSPIILKTLIKKKMDIVTPAIGQIFWGGLTFIIFADNIGEIRMETHFECCQSKRENN